MIETSPRTGTVIVRGLAHPAVIAVFTATILGSVSKPQGFPAPIRDAILRWYAENGRSLAFRRTSDPFAVLVSETMAQQTQAERAAAHWERFMARFPTVGSLAAATPAEVLRAWQGLGYDRRALALWRAARIIRDEHGGRVPDSVEALDALPGVGPYTARAVAAIAFDRPVGAVDVNVKRVIDRLLGGQEGLPASDVQAIADAAVASTDPATWTHAVMDLGAMVCRPRTPRCDACPVRRWCAYALAPTTPTTPTTPARSATSPTRPRTPFPATTRWLRGRILDRLREAPVDAWVALDAGIGTHALDRVHAAATDLATDGLVELQRRTATGLHARLATG
jgi:A/G-specific adenine glycosylase